MSCRFHLENNPWFECFSASNSSFVGNNNNDIVFCTFLAAGPLSVMVPEFSPFMRRFQTFSVVDVTIETFSPSIY
jgi:hypothetical protein